MAKMDIVCHVVDKKNKNKKGFLCFCKPLQDNPFLVIERLGPSCSENGQDSWVEVYKSEV